MIRRRLARRLESAAGLPNIIRSKFEDIPPVQDEEIGLRAKPGATAAYRATSAMRTIFEYADTPSALAARTRYATRCPLCKRESV
jgi:hypothetical protein